MKRIAQREHFKYASDVVNFINKNNFTQTDIIGVTGGDAHLEGFHIFYWKNVPDTTNHTTVTGFANNITLS